MKIIKKILAFGLIMAMLITQSAALASTNAGSSSSGEIILPTGGAINRDWITVSDWAWTYIENHFEKNLVPSEFYNITDFTAEITREQICKFIEPLLVNKGYVQNESVEQQFDDCDDSSVNLLAYLGIVTGTSEKTFEPTKSLTREEAATILYRLCEYTKIYEYKNASHLYAYKDHNDISDWAEKSVYAMYDSKIMSGTGDNCFSPKEIYTIEQAIKTVSEIYEIMTENTGYSSVESKGTILRADTEYILNQWDNEYYEIQYNDIVYISTTESIKDSILEFKAEDCAGMIAGKNEDIIYIAVNKTNDTSVIFKMPEKNEICTIPYKVRMIHNGYIITTVDGNPPSSPQAKFGVYDLEGKEILPPQYTWNEIQEKGYYTHSSAGEGGAGNSSITINTP